MGLESPGCWLDRDRGWSAHRRFDAQIQFWIVHAEKAPGEAVQKASKNQLHDPLGINGPDHARSGVHKSVPRNVVYSTEAGFSLAVSSGPAVPNRLLFF
jgi:hypothetical protein